MNNSLGYLGSKTVNIIRVGLGVSGIVAVVFGILALTFTGAALGVVGVFLGISVIVSGLVYFGVGVFAWKATSGWSRVAHVVLGIIMVIAGIIAMRNPVIGILALTFFIGVSWIFEGIVSLSVSGSALGTSWSIAYGILSIIAGVLLVFMPFGSSVALIIFAGVALIILGFTGFFRAFSFGKDT